MKHTLQAYIKKMPTVALEQYLEQCALSESADAYEPVIAMIQKELLDRKEERK